MGLHPNDRPGPLGAEPLGPEPVFTPVAADGFDWSDFGAGIGAGVGALLILAGLAVGAAAARRRRVAQTDPVATA